MAAGHAEAGQRVGEDFRAAPGEKQLGAGVDHCRASEGGADKHRVAPLPCQQQQASEHRAGEEHLLELTQLGDPYHHFVQPRAAMLLHQGAQALVEVIEVGIADKQRD